MDEWHAILAELERTTERAVLATILQVEGSAYRKAGATLLLLADGRQVGVLSAGCLEADLIARARELFAKEEAFAEGQGRLFSYTVLYDLRAEDDLSYGQGAGCDGAIQVLVEPIDGQMRRYWMVVKACLDQGVPVHCVRSLDREGTVNGYLFLTKERKWGAGGAEIPVTWQECQAEAVLLPASGVQLLTSDTVPHAASDKWWMQLIVPRPRLILFGAGSDVKPLASMAAQIGFAVVVADWRQAYCHPEHFPQADALLLGFPEQLVERLQLTANDSIVVMTHHFQRDKELLHLLLQKELRYLGLLGPRRRTERLAEGKELPAWVRAPVGLAIGAEGPAEIAVSILAELIQTLRPKRSAT